MPLPYTKLNPNVQTSKGEGKARYAPHKPLRLFCLIDRAFGCGFFHVDVTFV